MELKKMNAIELLKKAEITKEDFKHEVVFKTLFNLINEMICEEDKLENEFEHKFEGKFDRDDIEEAKGGKPIKHDLKKGFGRAKEFIK